MTALPQSQTVETEHRPVLLELKNLEVTYNQVVLAVRGVSMKVREGSVCALLGANGAGKSTMLRAISAVLTSQDGKVTDGTIHFDGRDITTLSADKIVRAGISQVPEGRQVFADLTVEENLRAAAFTQRDRKVVEQGLALVARVLPETGRPVEDQGRLSLRRRTADGRPRSGTYAASATADPGRAVAGSGPGDRGRDRQTDHPGSARTRTSPCS